MRTPIKKRSLWFPASHELAFAAHLVNAIILIFVWDNSDVLSVFTRTHFFDCTKTPCEKTLTNDLFSVSALDTLKLNEGLTAFSHALGVFLWWMGYTQRAESYRRWFEYAVTAGLLEVSILQVYGVWSFFSLALVIVINFSLQLSGGLSLDLARFDDSDASYSNTRALNLTQSFLLIGVQVAFTLTTALQSDVGDATTAWVYTIFYLSFGVVQVLSHTVEKFDEIMQTDYLYIVLGVTSKFVLTWYVVDLAVGAEEVLVPVLWTSVGIIAVYIAVQLMRYLWRDEKGYERIDRIPRDDYDVKVKI